MTTQVQPLPRLDPHFIYWLDALGSLALGVALPVTAAPLTELVGWPMPKDFLWVIGLLLVPWAVYNLWIARSPRPPHLAVRINIVGDVAWLGGTVILTALHTGSLTPLGLVILLGQGIAVTGILALKLVGARDIV